MQGSDGSVGWLVWSVILLIVSIAVCHSPLAKCGMQSNGWCIPCWHIPCPASRLSSPPFPLHAWLSTSRRGLYLRELAYADPSFLRARALGFSSPGCRRPVVYRFLVGQQHERTIESQASHVEDGNANRDGGVKTCTGTPGHGGALRLLFRRLEPHRMNILEHF